MDFDRYKIKDTEKKGDDAGLSQGLDKVVAGKHVGLFINTSYVPFSFVFSSVFFQDNNRQTQSQARRSTSSYTRD
jgi:hypothetical protein